jgi:hypothetical protein
MGNRDCVPSALQPSSSLDRWLTVTSFISACCLTWLCYLYLPTARRRFVDRDGDGYISADDIFAQQAMLMQKSEVFLGVRVAVSTVVIVLLIPHGDTCTRAVAPLRYASGLCQFAS